MRRAMLLAAAMTIPVSGALLLGTGQAFAEGPNGKITCTTISGTTTGTITVSGCTDSGSATASSSTNPAPTASLATGGTITFTNSVTVTFSAPTLGSASPKKCPGYSKTGGSNNPSAETFDGNVTGNTAGLKPGGTFKGAVCISSTGTISALKPTKTT